MGRGFSQTLLPLVGAMGTCVSICDGIQDYELLPLVGAMGTLPPR